MVIYPIVFFDALLMFALVPLLPDYVDALGMSKAQAGAVIGIYSAATLVMALHPHCPCSRASSPRLLVTDAMPRSIPSRR